MAANSAISTRYFRDSVTFSPHLLVLTNPAPLLILVGLLPPTALWVNKDIPFTLKNNGNDPTNVNSAKEKGSRDVLFQYTPSTTP